MSDGSYEVVFYRSPRGECFAEEFLDGLLAKVRGKILRWIEALETHGPNLPRPYADVVRGKIRELRIVFGGNQYRLLYFFSELDRAERLMQEWHQHGA